MEIMSLGYIGVSTRRLTDWSGFATGLLGMQLVDRGGGTRAFRMDDRRQRLLVSESDRESLAYLGFEVADASALDRMAARLDQHGIAVKRGSAALADERQVAGLVQSPTLPATRSNSFMGPRSRPIRSSRGGQFPGS